MEPSFHPYGKYESHDVARMELRQVNALALLLMVSQRLEPRFRRHLQISEIKLGLAFGRYLNDLNRLTAYHNVRKKKNGGDHFLHVSKVAAYTIKWILVESPVFSDITWVEFQQADEKTQEILLYANVYFAYEFLLHILGIQDLQEIAANPGRSRTLADVIYHMKKGCYSEKYFAATLHAMFFSDSGKVRND